MSQAVREARYLFIIGVAGLAFLAGLLPLVNLLTGVIGAVFAVAMVFGALFLVIARLRQGYNPAIAAIELTFIGGFVFIVLYGVMWYWLTYAPSQGASFWQFRLAAPTPHP